MVDNFDESQESDNEPTPLRLANWLEEQYLGDERFESIEVLEPGQLEGEAVRVKFVCNATTHFFVAVLEDESVVRVGLATTTGEVSEAIEEAANDTGDSLTEFLEDLMDAEAELENEVQHFQDDAYYFCSDLPYQRDQDLATDHFRDEIIYYLDGYLTALYDYIETKEE
jgi:hypothetical protein